MNMRKHFLTLLAIGGFGLATAATVWQTQSAPAAPQPSAPVAVAATAVADDGEAADDPLVFWNVLDSEPLLIDATEQITVNALQYGDGGGVEALIDGDESTWFHSSYGEKGNITDEEGNSVQVDNLYPASKHWIQFDLVEPQTDVIIKFVIRNSGYNDTPDDITFLATNDPDDARSWTEVAHFTDMLSTYSSTSEMAGQEYQTPHIGMGEAYRHLRMVVNRTYSKRTNDLGQYFWNMAELQVYPAYIEDDPITRLLLGASEYARLAENMYGIEDEYKGTLPGYFGAAEVDAYIAAFEQYLNAVEGDPTNEEVDVIISQMKQTYEAMMASEVKLGTGYYRFVSANENYFLQQDVEKAMCASEDGKWLRWGTLDEEDLNAVWILTQLEDGNFSIQNAQSKTYIDFIDATSSHVPMVEEQTTEQILTGVARGLFTIYNVKYNVPYHTESHNGGAGKEGYIVPWGNANEPNSVWYVRPVSEEEFQRLSELGNQATIDRDFAAARAAGKKAVMDAMEYIPYITEVNNDNDPSVSQLWSNALEHNEGSLENLIDGSTGSFFHSEWSQNTENAITDENHALFADLGTAAEKFFWTFTPRESAYLDIPADVIIYGSNDISNWEDPATWTEIDHVTKGFPTNISSTYVSPEIHPAAPVRFLKFEVLNTYSQRTNGTTGKHYFTMSEFQVYSYDFDQVHSQYINAEGMKDAVDKLNQLMEELDKKDRITRVEVNQLEEAVAAVNELYVDHTQLALQLSNLLPDAELAVKNATEPVKKLITSGTQLGVNSKIREGSFLSILDGDWGSHFSTDWDDGAQFPDGTYGDKHHLQVNLKAPQEKVRLRMVGRYSYYFDMPQDIDIYVTNDEGVGTNILSDNEEWSLLTNINEGLPQEPWTEWTSDEMDLGGNQYLRIVVNDTWMNTSGTMERHDNYGQCFFTLAEFQVLQDVDPSEIQYAYVPDVKKWADTIAQLIEENKDKDKYDIWPRDVEALTEAMAQLDSAFVHTDALREVVDKARNLAAGAEVGDDFAYVPSQKVIDDLNAVCDAATVVLEGKSLQPQVDAEGMKVEQAMNDFLAQVKMPELNKWYNIVNVAKTAEIHSTDEEGNDVVTIQCGYCAGQAIATRNYALGDPITFGYYDLENEEATYSDAANAFWRFVPIEGSDCVAIQNMATGHYIGATTIVGDGEGRPVQVSEPAPYKIEYFGAGELLFFSQDSLNINGSYVPLHAQERNGAPLVGWREEHGNASCWNLKEVNQQAEELTLPAKLNTISIMALPFDIDEATSISKLNPGEAKTYALAAIETNDDGTTNLNLVEREGFKAGEPFFLAFGDFEDEEAEAEDAFIYVNRPTDIVPGASVDGNGLVAAVDGAVIEEEGLGYLRGNKVLASGAGRISIPGLSGYIQAGLCQNTDAAPDLVLVCGQTLANGIEVVAIERPVKASGTFDLTGRRVRRPVHGLYIQDGRKVMVK